MNDISQQPVIRNPTYIFQPTKLKFIEPNISILNDFLAVIFDKTANTDKIKAFYKSKKLLLTNIFDPVKRLLLFRIFIYLK